MKSQYKNQTLSMRTVRLCGLNNGRAIVADDGDLFVGNVV
jgi:hypothetical protein